MIKVDVPNGKSGYWAVQSFTIDEDGARRYNSHHRVLELGIEVSPGEYKRLVYRNEVIMSNTPSEVRQHLAAIEAATGNVLVMGLGLGMYLKAILEKDDVTQVTVVEKSADVIKLVAPSFAHDSRLLIIEGDAFEFKPSVGVKYDFIWHDIWPDICEDNLEEMGKLRRRFGRRAKKQMCWAERECKAMKRQEGRRWY